MDEAMLIDMINAALTVVIKASAPCLLTGLIIGVSVSIFQTVTSIQDQTLSFVPKLLAMFAALSIFGSFIFSTVTEYMRELFINLHQFIK